MFFGYRLIIPHHGTIVVGGSNHIGKYAVPHTSICISDNGKKIGDVFYCATGVKMISKLTFCNNISVGANSQVNISFIQNKVLIGGVPAKVIKEETPWYIRDHYDRKVSAIEFLREQYKL